MNKKGIIKNFSIIFSSAILGAIIFHFYYVLKSQNPTNQPKLIVARENSANFKFINPILFTDTGSKNDYPELKNLQNNIQKYISSQTNSGNASDISVYIRNMNSGHWTGVNENDTYAPASMLKVAMLIAYKKLSESDPTVLNKNLFYIKNLDNKEYFKSTDSLQGNQSYTASELINDMITRSGNDSQDALLKNIDATFLSEVYDDLLITLPHDNNGDIDFLSPKAYSWLFRTLYNGAYLSNADSENSLSLLSQTEFDQGLKSGLPAWITVSHKFGERTKLADDGITVTGRELHDCGIVYYPNYPYFICVMTKGNDFNNLENVIQSISKMTFDEVELNLAETASTTSTNAPTD